MNEERAPMLKPTSKSVIAPKKSRSVIKMSSVGIFCFGVPSAGLGAA